MILDYTERGFGVIKFTDLGNEPCTLQKSSIATRDAIWFGTMEDAPLIIEDKFIARRMHLSREMVIDILPHLLAFAATGDIELEQDNG